MFFFLFQTDDVFRCGAIWKKVTEYQQTDVHCCQVMMRFYIPMKSISFMLRYCIRIVETSSLPEINGTQFLQ